MKKNRIIILLTMLSLLILSSFSVLSSERSFSYETFFNDTVIPKVNGNAYIGKLLLNPEITNESVIEILKINNQYVFSDSVIEGDYIKPMFGSIVINGQFIEKNSTYKMSNQGLINFYEGVDPTKNGQIQVLDLPYEVLQINDVENSFGLSFSENSFVLDEEKVIDIYTDIPISTSPRNYTFSFDINSSNNVTNIEDSINIGEVGIWNVTVQKHNSSVVIGDSIKYMTMEFNLRGNSEKKLYFLSDGNISELINVQSDTTLYVGIKSKLVIPIEVPSNYSVGKYNGTFFIYDDEMSRNFSISVNVIDGVMPEIYEISMNDTYMSGQESKIEIKTRDNGEIRKVDFELFVMTDDGYDMINNGTLKRENSELYVIKMVKSQIGEYKILFKSYDNSGNMISAEKEFEILPLEYVVSEDYVNFGKIKMGEWVKLDAFEVLNETKGEASFIKMSCLEEDVNGEPETDCQEVQFAIIYKNGKIQEFEDGISIKFDDVGKYKIAVKSEVQGEFDGELKLVLPNNIKKVSNIGFRFNSVNYEVVRPENGVWMDKEFNCDVDDTGMVDTSSITCEFTYPITANFYEESLPVTPDQKRLWEVNFKEEIKEGKNKIFILTLALIFAILLVLFFLFLTIAQSTVVNTFWYMPNIKIRNNR